MKFPTEMYPLRGVVGQLFHEWEISYTLTEARLITWILEQHVQVRMKCLDILK